MILRSYNLFLDTTGSDFVLVLFDINNKVIDNRIHYNYKKKVDLLVLEFENLLIKNNLEISNVKGLYLNLGPGFFTGVRTAFVFFRTLALLNEIEFYTTTTFELLNKQILDEPFLYIDAQGNKLYCFDVLKFKQNKDYINAIKVVEKQNQNVSKINYDLMLQDFGSFIELFQIQQPMQVEPIYIKKPQIGGL
ncbi:tRNA threonylcarbamoyl adenosine modification protein YeaZ [Mycoplasmopsis mustelae]|uniref:tRNA threonylcarbamoyl adenosine modification protein YeaZ n=2 Tax=Mycoplasmopsis mustelae TaxID=171289 RepID=A0A4R7UF65_9BACT|nr:tRNA threonylcarbamoyl adenosine modification protein YeaZ [Mycoplasmopsis mustelae]